LIGTYLYSSNDISVLVGFSLNISLNRILCFNSWASLYS